MIEATSTVSWSVAFGAGLLSFFSPCVAPVVPGYLSFVSGTALGIDPRDARGTERVIIASLLFVLGFSLVFVALGTTAGALGGLLEGSRTLLDRLAGVVMVVMGLFVLGLIRVPLLGRERRYHFIDRPYGPLGAVLVGMAFGFGWTPCIGPILASILLYASAAETAQEGGVLLLIYSLGLGLPFVMAALGFRGAAAPLMRLRRSFVAANVISGALLIGMGALFLANRGFYVTYMNVAAQRLFETVVR